MPDPYLSIYVCMYVCKYIYIYIYICIYIYIFVYLHTYLCLHVYKCDTLKPTPQTVVVFPVEAEATLGLVQSRS